jgi:hypothetical protein
MAWCMFKQEDQVYLFSLHPLFLRAIASWVCRGCHNASIQPHVGLRWFWNHIHVTPARSLGVPEGYIMRPVLFIRGWQWICRIIINTDRRETGDVIDWARKLDKWRYEAGRTQAEPRSSELMWQQQEERDTEWRQGIKLEEGKRQT